MDDIVATDRARWRTEIAATVRLASPLIIGQLSGVGMSLVDALLAGHLNAHTLGAVAVGSSIWSLAFVAAIGVMLALPPSVAQLHGAKRDDEIAPLFHQAVWLSAALGVVLLIAVRYGGPALVALIGIDTALQEDTAAFLRAISWGAPALAGYFALRGLSEGLGLTRPTMYFGALGLLALVPLGWILMYGPFGLPAWGARGCGAATALVLWLQWLGFLAWLRWHPAYRRLHLFAHIRAPSATSIAALLRLGVPMGVSLLMEAGLFVAVALTIGRLGETTAASHQVALNVASVAFMIPLGLALATTVRVGHAVGRRDARGVRLAGYAGITLSLATQTVSSLTMLLFPYAIASLYTHDATVIALAGQLLVLAGIFQLSDGIQVASNGALRGLKDTRVPMAITTLAYWGIGMPVGWWLAFPQQLGARGMWMGLIAGLSTAALLLFLRFRRISTRVMSEEPLRVA